MEKEEGGMNWESSTDIYTLPYVKWIAKGTCCITRGAQLGAPMGTWEGGSRGSGYMYTYGWFWRMNWQPASIFLPGKSHGQRSIAGYSPWGHKESDMT